MPNELGEIKSYLEERVGEEICVTVQLGRKRQKERRGVLTETYRSIFIVCLDQDENDFERSCFSYRDVLTKAIELEFV
ncbi:Veg family protein [Falseniella ignava]|uniref:Veg protein n=2 Tax=Falseniella ignava TaxID=137730 RepID=K1M381_9LACT|nr:Veg family protein [Falseniella ignava]EKB58717.1 hypothetical protein HMPREF9707_00146 [Falseniella ignava CCUG 37419]PKY90670.1 hypothetical protein CYJ57_00410 [Falseniella ignava]